MKPMSFDLETSREVLGDSLVREIESKARSDVDQKHFEPPSMAQFPKEATPWDKCMRRFEYVVYISQYEKRRLRLQRLSSSEIA